MKCITNTNINNTKSKKKIEFIKKLFKNKITFFSIIIILIYFIIGIFAPYIALNNPKEVELVNKLRPPGGKYPFGTDHLGRCIFSRVIYGTRISLFTSLIILSTIMIISVPIGYIAGYYGGIIDSLIMRLVDIILAFPSLILSLVIAGMFGPSLKNIMIAIAAVWWAGYARLIRAMVLSEREKDYILANKACGTTDIAIFIRHIIPNITSQLLVLCTIDLGHIILTISALSFLGLGAQPPTPEWGGMLSDGRGYMQIAPNQVIFPGAAIMIIVLAFNLLGDGLRDILDPKE